MKKRYRLTHQAEADVVAIWVYIARDNPKAADRLLRRLTKTYELLAANPAMGGKQNQFRPGLRSISIDSTYIIFYERIDKGIIVYRVLHGARNLTELLD